MIASPIGNAAHTLTVIKRYIKLRIVNSRVSLSIRPKAFFVERRFRYEVDRRYTWGLTTGVNRLGLFNLYEYRRFSGF